MARLRFIAGLLGAALVAVLLVVAVDGGGSGSDAYRVDAIFDVARGIGPRQVVKIAGARVGTVIDVRLTSDDKARVEMAISRGMAPFHADASCRIEPEGIISENFVACLPGSPAAGVLRALPGATGAADVPTVPVAHTTEPVSLQDLFDIWSTPVSQRVSVLLDELGIGLSGRADDLGAVLDRANPSLAEADRAIALVNRQRAQLQDLVDAAAPVVHALAARSSAVDHFLRSTAALTTVTASHRDALAQAIARLPPLLSAARPALQQLDGVAADTTPLLAQIRGAAPALTRLTTTLPPFASSATTALTQLRPGLVATRAALDAGTATFARLRTFAADADPAGEGLDRLLVSIRDSGAVESLLQSLYDGAALTSHYTADSHVIFADLLENACAVYATTPSRDCDAHLNGTATIPAGLATTSSNARGRTPASGGAGGAGGQSAQGAGSTSGSISTTPTPRSGSAGSGPSSTSGTTGPSGPTAPVVQTLQHLLGFLLR